MRKRAEFPVLINAQIPDDGGKEDNRAFHEEVTLLLHPRLVQVEHNRIGTLVGIRNVRHEVGVDGIATVRPSRVVEVDDIELRFYLISVQVVDEVIVGYHRQVGKLEVIDIHRIPLFYLLLDERVNHGIRLSTARRTEHDGGTEWIHHVDPPVVPFLLVVEACGQINGVFILHIPRFLHKTLVFVVEHIVHQVVL